VTQGGPPLSSLLSWALVAFTIEADNAFEESMPHRTTAARQAGARPHGPWLVSSVMWYSCMQFVAPEGIALDDLEHVTFGQCALRGSNPGMVRWGYVTLDGDGVVRATPAGARAQERWAPLPGEVERGWRARLGEATVAALRGALVEYVERIEIDLPDSVPKNAAHGGRLATEQRPRARDRADFADRDLPVLLSKALLGLTLEYERGGALSLSHAANPMRVLVDGDVAVRDFARRTGVAKETLASMTKWLTGRGFVQDVAVGAAKGLRITGRGRQAIEASAHADDAQLRAAIEPIVGDLDLATSPLAAAIVPPASGWRATARAPETLPHHPVVSHRGGYPDGS
jgi:GNAT superfamily N-acetyltransferase